MSLERGFSWNWEDWQFVGYTLAGITTSLYCKNASVCFDVGQGLPFQVGAKRILITHSHMDHAAGLPYLVAQKNMMGQKETEIFVPENFLEPLREIFRVWQECDGHEYSFSLQAARPGEIYDLDKLYAFKPFRTVHRVNSQGYLLYQKKKRLKERFRGASREEILSAKAKGEDPNESVLEPAIAFTGDTQIEFLDSDPDVGKAKILFVEATFWDENRPVSHAREWGHIHIDEILEALPRLQNEKIVLIHTSVRYSLGALEEILERRLPQAEKSRVMIFPRPS
jgi:ribonuclease Z